MSPPRAPRDRECRARSGFAAFRFATTVAAVLVAGACWAQPASRTAQRPEDQIAPFRVTGYEGHALTGFLGDATDASSGSTRTNTTLSQWRTDLYLLAHGYVYLPGFLAVDLGGGPVFDATRHAADGSSTTSRKPLYNLLFRVTALRDKPYRGEVYYEHLNPVQNVGPSQTLLSESRRLGAGLALLPPAIAVPLYFDASRRETKGRGTDQVLDDRTDQASVRGNFRLGKLGETQVRYESLRQASRSGSTGVPIQESSSRSEVFTMDARAQPEGGRHELTGNLYYFSQAYSAAQGTLADTRDARLNLDLRNQHSEALRSYARYVLSSNRADSRSTTLNALSAGASYRATEDLFGSLDAHGDSVRTAQFDAGLASGSASGTWRAPLALGRLSASLTLGGGIRDQVASGDVGEVVGERLVLAGTAPTALRREQVVARTVVLSNVPRTQVFTEGVDFLLTVVGLVTRVERLASGNIVDGQEVLADYSFEVGGTFRLARFDQSASLGWEYEDLFSVYARHVDARPRLQSGRPTFQLNPLRNTLFGARGEVPISGSEYRVGGSAERERRRERISPGGRTAWELYLQGPLPLLDGLSAKAGIRRSSVDYDLTAEQNVRLTSQELRFWGRPLRGLDLSLEALRDRDSGKALPRERTHVAAKAQWRIRQFRLGFDLSRTREKQGDYERRRNYVQLALRRDF